MTRELFLNGLCPSLQPGGNRMSYEEDTTNVWLSSSPSSPWLVCLPPMTAKNKIEVFDLVSKQSLKYFEDFIKIQQECLKPKHSTPSPANITFVSSFVRYGPDGNPRPRQRSDETYQDLMNSTRKHDLDISCHDAFAARWYDASDQVITKLCREALNKTLTRSSQNPVDRCPGTLPSFDKYEYSLVTGFPGNRFKSGKSNSRYQGFVICANATTLTDDDVMRRFKKPESHLNAKMAQRLCKDKSFHNHSRNVSIFYSTARIRPNGRIIISNRDHEGRIGNCWTFLLEELEALISTKKPQKTREVSNVTLSDQVMSKEDIVKAFTEAERKGMINISTYHGDSADRWNDTGTWNWSATQAALQSDGASAEKLIGGCSPEACANSEALLSYWPYVLGAAGAIGTLFTAKKVWDCRKPHSGKDYGEVTQETSAV
eukprot:Blabericola_migrator_1__6681@NODE_3378_length_1821_cov_8_769669_g1569_i2_p1_GENE_NODE_3378_length_1821_cov_8_769669_g1569_i2NODE_3378_length_1821_cov_8_769669_g1569_i2_p1_ORF_typecomplete_len461_score43_77_NODE_3378_length_1821_cov_8_769669_g1569_i2951384